MIQILFALLAGVLTIGAPCILPLLPILLGTSVGQTSRTRPLFIVAGFVLVFSLLGIFLSYITIHLGVDPNTLRNAAIFLLALFGILLIWPKPFELLMVHLNGFINRASSLNNNSDGTAKRDNISGFILGVTLGVIWTPCAGPVLGAILTLIAAQANIGRAAVLLIAYAIGAGIPMLIIAYGSQYVTTKVRSISRYSQRLQQVFGVIILLLAIAMFFQYDTIIQSKLTALFPTSSIESRITEVSTGSTNNNEGNKTSAGPAELKNLGAAPEFTGIEHWINSDPLTIAQLKGKVVLIDFWTYSCINCIRTLPYVTKWYDTYKDQGFVVIGVHTPEFPFEKQTSNVETATKRFNINYPVAQDNVFGTWNAYGNQYWPAEYLIDQNGNVMYTHFGEGNYDKTENAIRQLLGLDTSAVVTAEQTMVAKENANIKSPEMYFGTDRLQYLTAEQKPSTTPMHYVFPSSLSLNTFALDGDWQHDGEKVRLTNGTGKIKLHFSSGKVFMVAASSGKPVTLHILVDGKAQPDVTVTTSQLYTLFNSSEYTDHTIEIQATGPEFEAFTFTFG